MCETMILVSVGSEFPVGKVVHPRIRNPALAAKAKQMYGSLPFIVPGLHEEAAADLMAAATLELRVPNSTVVKLYLDVPMMQRSKHYYLNKIQEFLQHCKDRVGMYVATNMYMYYNHVTKTMHTVYIIIISTALIKYLGHSEKGTGNWCFKDGTISFQEIFNLYRKFSAGKTLSLVSDCCYSGHWVRKCAKTLDSLRIPPCGHRAREKGTLIKVIASCRPDEEAGEPCYSIEALKIEDDGSTIDYAEQLTHQKSVWFDSTRLVCYKDPDSPCPKTTFQHLKWDDAVDQSMNIQSGKRNEGGRDMWYYIMLHRAGKAYQEAFISEFTKDRTLRLRDWGYVLESGEGTDIPQEIKDKVRNWTTIANM